MSDDLTVLRAEFPAYRIWREEVPDRPRYVARSRHQGLHPHTVVTPDLRELRDALRPEQAQSPVLLAQPGAFNRTGRSR